MERLTDEQLAEIRKRAEASTPGPWAVEKDSYVCNAGFWVTDTVIMPDVTSNIFEAEDAEFIAHAREDVPKLLAEIGRLRKLAHEILEEYDQSERSHIGMSANYYENKARHERYIAEFTSWINGDDSDA